MIVTNLARSKELYEISGWNDTFWNYNRSLGRDGDFTLSHKGSIETREVKERIPAYDLGYILDKLKTWRFIDIEGRRKELVNIMQADFPEDTAAFYAIKLFKQGWLKK